MKAVIVFNEFRLVQLSALIDLAVRLCSYQFHFSRPFFCYRLEQIDNTTFVWKVKIEPNTNQFVHINKKNIIAINNTMAATRFDCISRYLLLQQRIYCSLS